MWQIAIDEPLPFELPSPRTLDEALEMAARYVGDCAFLAGGCDPPEQLNPQRTTTHYAINLKMIPAMRGVEAARQGMHQEHAIFRGSRCYTLSPSDTAPMLVALEAQAQIHGTRGVTTVPVAELFTPPDENITTMRRVQRGEILGSIVVQRYLGQR